MYFYILLNFTPIFADTRLDSGLPSRVRGPGSGEPRAASRLDDVFAAPAAPSRLTAHAPFFVIKTHTTRALALLPPCPRAGGRPVECGVQRAGRAEARLALDRTRDGSPQILSAVCSRVDRIPRLDPYYGYALCI
jgi:hypothetical protein